MLSILKLIINFKLTGTLSRLGLLYFIEHCQIIAMKLDVNEIPSKDLHNLFSSTSVFVRPDLLGIFFHYFRVKVIIHSI